jgi:hypothetical protein
LCAKRDTKQQGVVFFLSFLQYCLTLSFYGLASLAYLYIVQLFFLVFFWYNILLFDFFYFFIFFCGDDIATVVVGKQNSTSWIPFFNV